MGMTREVFAPQRMCTTARERGLNGGWSLDVTIQYDITRRTYDLRSPGHQKEVETYDQNSVDKKSRLSEEGWRGLGVKKKKTYFSILPC